MDQVKTMFKKFVFETRRAEILESTQIPARDITRLRNSNFLSEKYFGIFAITTMWKIYTLKSSEEGHR